MSIADVRGVLRALADVRDTDFYTLWVDLTRAWPEPLPEIEFRIYRVADSLDARAVVSVEGTRPDGIEFAWTLSVSARANVLVISGSINRVSPDGSVSNVFSRSEEGGNAEYAADLIRALAAQVCGQRGELGPT